MHIDFILDIGCLWSYVTWRHLRTAMKSFPCHFEIAPFFVPPHSFFPGFSVNPADRARLLRGRAEPLLRQSGINVCFDALPDLPEDVSLPCRLICRAVDCRKGNDVLSDVFDAFFISGQNICDTDILMKIAGRHGLSGDCLRQYPPAVLPRLTGKEPPRAVPCLIFDRKAMIFGAQSVACLKNMLSLALCLQKEKIFE